MKKILAVAVVVLTLISFTTMGIAKEAVKKAEVVKGEIVSIDTAKNEVVVKDAKANAEKTIVVDPKEITNLKKGEKVKAILKEGTNTAEKIKVYPTKK
jgi:predicted dinucleotide-binding enzyme